MNSMYTIKISTDNAAFDPYPTDEIARIVREVATFLDQGIDKRFILRDINGNKVGTAEFTPEEDNE